MTDFLSLRPRIVVASVGIHHPGGKNTFTIPYGTLHLYFYHGEMSYMGKKIDLRPGLTALIPPGASTTYTFSRSPSRHIYFHLEYPALIPPGPRAHQEIITPADAAMESRIREALNLSDRSRPEAEVKLWDVLLDLRRLWAAQEKGGGGKRTRAEETARYIREHLAEDLSLESLCRAQGIGANRLNALFKEELGTTVGQFILRTRIDRAVQLLSATDLPVKEVAWECGIGDLQYFNKLVRRRAGLSPRKLRGVAPQR